MISCWKVGDFISEFIWQSKCRHAKSTGIFIYTSSPTLNHVNLLKYRIQIFPSVLFEECWICVRFCIVLNLFRKHILKNILRISFFFLLNLVQVSMNICFHIICNSSRRPRYATASSLLLFKYSIRRNWSFLRKFLLA